MHVVLLHNESAGDGDWSRADLERLVRRVGFKPRYHSLKTALKDPDLLDDGEFVVVAGGDGSVRKVALQLIGRKRPLAPLPLGTANNIARSLGLHESPEKIARGWRKARRVPFDVGFADGPWGRRPFVEGVGLGLIGLTISALQFVDEASKHDLDDTKDQLHRDASVVTALAREMRGLSTAVTISGRKRTRNFLLLEILNIRRAGPALDLAPDSDPSDGWLQVVGVEARERSLLLKVLEDRLRGRKNRRRLPSRRAQRVRLECPACDLRIDDGTFAVKRGTIVDVSLQPGALEFLLPG